MKVEAIHLLREQSGMSLAEAVHAIEVGTLPETSAATTSVAELGNEVTAALAQGNTIQAIKLLRQAKGLTLQQAKAIAEEAAKRVGPPPNRRRPGLAPGELPRPTVSASLAVAIATLAAAAAWFILGKA